MSVRWKNCVLVHFHVLQAIPWLFTILSDMLTNPT
jgi:hypothetical protein